MKRLFPVVAITTAAIAAVSIYGCGPRIPKSVLERIPPLVEVTPAAPPVEAERGMVVAGHPLASQAGVDVLKDGGNAVDAAIAALFVLNVVEPQASGLGGGGFALVRMANDSATVVDYRERAPRGVDPAYYYDPRDSTHYRLQHGGAAVCVPGAAAGWAELYDRWGTLPLERLARDGIKYAEEGFPVSDGLSSMITDYTPLMQSDPNLAAIFLHDSLPPIPGDTLKQPALAKTFRYLAAHGLRSFYRGTIAESIVDAVRADSGSMTLMDLESFRATVTLPIEGEYRGCRILTLPPPSGGGAALVEILNILKQGNYTSDQLGSSNSLHLLAQVFKQGYADSRYMIGDPEFYQTDWRRMLTPEFAVIAGKGINETNKAGGRRPALLPPAPNQGNTTHLVVVDKDRNAVSLTQSINYFFGAGVYAANAGLLLNNQMADFGGPMDSLNTVAGWHRPRSNMTPVILIKDKALYMTLGTPGGSRITSTIAEILINNLDKGMDISAAIDYPRFFSSGPNIFIESRTTMETLKSLMVMGYGLDVRSPYDSFFGGAHGITVTPSGKLQGAADKRRHGEPRGY